MACEHMNFRVTANIGRLTDHEGGPVTAFLCEMKVNCSECGKAMQFMGLPLGVDLRSACVSPDGMEARLALMPEGEVLPDPKVRGARITLQNGPRTLN